MPFKRPDVLIFITIIGFLVLASHARNQVWQSELSLWADAVKKSPNKDRPYCGLATALMVQGRNEEAGVQFANAVQVDPNSSRANYDYGTWLSKQGKFEEAILYFLKTIGIRKFFQAEAHNNLGYVLVQLDRRKEAQYHFGEALRIRPGFKEAKRNLGLLKQ